MRLKYALGCMAGGLFCGLVIIFSEQVNQSLVESSVCNIWKSVLLILFARPQARTDLNYASQTHEHRGIMAL